METLPTYIAVTFCAATFISIWLFYKACRYSIALLAITLTWIVAQSCLAALGFYINTVATPPRIIFLFPPTLLLIAITFYTKAGKIFIDGLDLKTLTILHTIRIPVEIVLYWLFVHNTIPQLMTFEGRNFDIIAGLTAPLIFYFGFVKKTIGTKTTLAWNFISLALLLNIVINAILSAPTPLQQFAFDQPNIAILYFPFILLPGIVVPIVLFSHLVLIKRLWKSI